MTRIELKYIYIHLYSPKNVNQFVHVSTSVDTQHFIQIHARILTNLTHRQTDRQTNERRRAGENIYVLVCQR